MKFIFFIVLGMLDVFAIFALIFKTFRFPYFEYFKEITILAVITSIVSYIIRVYFSINPIFDIIAHYILYVSFLWLVVRSKLWISLVTSVMYFVYGVISGLVYFFYVSTNIFTSDALESSYGYESFIIQLTQQGISIIIAYLFYRFDIGITKFSRPPHDFVAKTTIKKRDLTILYCILIAALISFVGSYFAYHTKYLLVIPIYLTAVLFLFYFAYKREKTSD